MAPFTRTVMLIGGGRMDRKYWTARNAMLPNAFGGALDSPCCSNGKRAGVEVSGFQAAQVLGAVGDSMLPNRFRFARAVSIVQRRLFQATPAHRRRPPAHAARSCPGGLGGMRGWERRRAGRSVTPA